MKCYESFRYESRRLHAIRLAHVIYPVKEGPKTWDEAGPRRNSYRSYLDGKWPHLQPYCVFKADITRVYFLNPADLGRWGGDFLPWRIGNYHRSWMMPTKLIITTCSDEEVDGKLRDALCVPSTNKIVGQVEVLSWFGYSPKDHETGMLLMGAFRLLGEQHIEKLKSFFTQIAFVFLQHQSIDILTDVSRFFEGLDVLTVPHLGTKWTPLLCGLLKGNIDGFVLLGKSWVNDAALDNEAEELSSYLTDRALRKKGDDSFWTRVSPVAVYIAKAAENDAIDDNLKLLYRLRLPVVGAK